MNNGAHFIDLLMYFFGGASEIKLINKGRYWEGTDPEPDFSIKFGDVEVIFLAGRQECFEINRLELIGTNGRIEYGKGRIEYQLIKPDPVFSGYKILDDKKNKIATDSMRYQLYVFEHLAQHLNDNLPLNSNGDTAIETLNVVEQIKERL
jgi:predicted dehydrogenase